MCVSSRIGLRQPPTPPRGSGAVNLLRSFHFSSSQNPFLSFEEEQLARICLCISSQVPHIHAFEETILPTRSALL